MRITSHEYISVEKWCKPVDAAGLITGSGNLVYFADSPVEPALVAPQFRVDTGFPDDVFSRTEEFGVNLNLDTGTVRATSRPFVARLENVRVERPGFGIILDRHLIMDESYHNRTLTEESKVWYGAHSTRRSAQFSVDYQLGSDNFTSRLDTKYYIDRDVDRCLNSPAMLLSGPSFYNYHHWLLEMLPRIWWHDVIPGLKDLPLIIHSPLLPFQVETLAALGIGAERLLPFDGWMLQADCLYFSSCIAPGNASIRNIKWLKERLKPAFGVAEGHPRDLIYVSRRKAGARRLLNEDQVVAALDARGFKTMMMEDYSVKEQIEIFSNARVVVMPNGAAGINMAFSSPGATLIELIPASYLHCVNWIYSSLSGCRYGRLICDDSISPQRDMVINIEALKNITDQALAS